MGRTLTNDFSWSKSRHEKMSECLRAYYLTYYRSWGGWERSSPPEVRELYVLKKLHNRFTWAGGVVHETVREALLSLRMRREMDPLGLIARAHRLMQSDFRYSADKGYWRERHRKNFAGLVEHEYGEPLPSSAWKQNWEAAKSALEWFFSSRFIPLAKSLRREQWLEVDETDFDRSVFYLDGVKVFAVPDFAYLESDGTPVVVDWKTGQSRDGYSDQLMGYALYLESRYGLPATSVRASLVYLNEGVERTVGISGEALERFRAGFQESVQRMRGLLQDPARNTPREAEAFPMTDNLNACAFCAFRRPCGRAGGAPSP